MANNYLEVKSHYDGPYMIYLEIVLPNNIDWEWEQCYKKAFMETSYCVTLRFSGAPTIDKVSFSGNSIFTNSFSRNESVMNDAKEFLKELDLQIGKTNDLYARLQNEKEEAEKREKEEEQKAKDNLKKADDFFNDR